MRAVKQDTLWRQLQDLPYFRALLRAVESRFYQGLELPRPVLDLGCGDGHFAAATFDQALDVGIDPWGGPLRQAAKTGGYHLVLRGYGDRLPFADAFFGSAISNSVLEHIPELEAVLAEMARVLKAGAPFIFCVPNHNFLANLSVSGFLERAGMKPAAEAYRRFFNWISRHHHCDAPETWLERLDRAGFELVRWWHYFSPAALRVLEWGHYFGLPSLAAKRLFGRWILAPAKWNLAFTRALVRPYYEESWPQPQGAYTFYIARRKVS